MFKKLLILALLLSSLAYATKPLHIVAAENFYGQIAEQLGGQYVEVNSILKNPKQDPHLFSTSPTTAKAIADADLIIYNGLDYDVWMENLITANPEKKPILVVADLINKKSGDNPHIWYDPNTMLVYATHLVDQLSILDSEHKKYFQQQLVLFKQRYEKLNKQIDADKVKFQSAPVIAVEPIFNYMADRLGLKMYGLNFQLSIMNDSEPSATDIKDFQDKLNNRLVKVLILNNQVIDPLTQGMQQLAEKNNIPSIGVSETEPEGQDYFTWMSSQLTLLENALGA